MEYEKTAVGACLVKMKTLVMPIHNEDPISVHLGGDENTIFVLAFTAEETWKRFSEGRDFNNMKYQLEDDLKVFLSKFPYSMMLDGKEVTVRLAIDLHIAEDGSPAWFEAPLDENKAPMVVNIPKELQNSFSKELVIDEKLKN